MTIALFLLLVALNVADAILTMRVLAAGGVERNPLVAAVTKRLGVVPGLAVIKVAGLAIVYVWLLQPVVLTVLCAAFAGICAWNVWQLRQQCG